MENETVNSFLGDLAKQDDVFESPKEEAVIESKEEIPAESKVEEEKLPFHEDPKVQRYIEKMVNKKLEDFKPTASEQFKEEVTSNPLIDSFTTIIGNDTPEKVQALKALERTINSLEEKARKAEEASEFVKQSQQEIQEEKANLEYLENGFDAIENTFKVDLSSDTLLAKKTKNEFIDFIEKIAPKNADGEITSYPDLVSSFEVFKSIIKPVGNSQAKSLAARGMTRSGESTNTPTERPTIDNVRRLLGLE